jgi:hypothetical protein
MLWNAGLLGIVDRRWLEIECFHMLGGPGPERLKDAAPNLFHPTASPPFPKGRIFHVTTQTLKGGDDGEGDGLGKSDA